MINKPNGAGLVDGNLLHPDDQRAVLAQYCHRFTIEHRPAWASQPRPDGSAYMPQFASDVEWLANTQFTVRNDGRLDQRVKYCASYPTWPQGQHA